MRTIPALVAAAGVVTMLLAACGSSGASDGATDGPAESWDEVASAAEQEGAITIYAGTSRPILERVVQAFNGEHPGITVDILDGEGPDLNARIDQEVESGSVAADIYLSTHSQWIVDADDRGIFEPLLGPAAAEWPEEFRVGDSYVVAILAAGIVVNTDLVTEPVTGYEDLLRSEFADGRLGVQQWSNNIAPGFYAHVEDTFPGLLDEIAAQGTTTYRNSEAGAASVASGERSAALWSVPAVPVSLIAQGAPIDFVIPDDPYGLMISMNALAGAPHPNAAQVLIDFVLSQEGQELWNQPDSGQASPLGFGDFDPNDVTVWDPSTWTSDEVAEAEGVWLERFGG